jgi:hypothetical protein
VQIKIYAPHPTLTEISGLAVAGLRCGKDVLPCHSS